MFRPGFTFYDFQVTNGTETKTVSWSSGTGDIGPTFFDFDGQRYVLELKASKAFDGFMKNSEMVVWKRAITTSCEDNGTPQGFSLVEIQLSPNLVSVHLRSFDCRRAESNLNETLQDQFPRAGNRNCVELGEQVS